VLSNPQKSLIKRAQRQARLNDDDYRDVLQTVSGCRSTTCPQVNNRHCDKILAYIEAIYWRKVDQNELTHAGDPRAVFQQRGYWSQKNTKQETSRDRYTQADASTDIEHLESDLAALGYGPSYCAGIRQTVTKGATNPRALNTYAAALRRTLKSKQPKDLVESEDPF
jgi:hypothetical protein